MSLADRAIIFNSRRIKSSPPMRRGANPIRRSTLAKVLQYEIAKMKTHQILLTCSLICLVLSLLFSQQNAVAAPLNTNIDFTGFTGSGFAPSPAAGQLDSDTWRLTGMSTGDQTFGGTHTSDDSARGSDTGGTTTGGVYAFDRGGGNIGLGVQPTGSDFTPGEITLRLRNETGTTVTNINVAYYLGVFNDLSLIHI